MWRAVVLVGVVGIASLVGCDEHAGGPDALVVAPFPIDLVVGPESVAIYTNSADQVGCACVGDNFAQPAGCKRVTDDNNCACASCFLAITIESGGQEVGSAAPPFDYQGEIDLRYTVAGPDLTLTLIGCGHAPARIDLSGHSFLTATTTATYDPVAGTSVQWTTDAPAIAADVSLRYPEHGLECASAASPYVFPATAADDPSDPPYMAAVTVFSASETRATSMGPATIWWGGGGGWVPVTTAAAMAR